MRSRITEPGFEMAGKTGTAQVRVITREERAQRRDATERKPAVEIARARPVHRFRAGRRTRAMPLPSSSSMAATSHTEPQVQFARDILLFAQKRDTLGKPTAYPMNAAERR